MSKYLMVLVATVSLALAGSVGAEVIYQNDFGTQAQQDEFLSTFDVTGSSILFGGTGSTSSRDITSDGLGSYIVPSALYVYTYCDAAFSAPAGSVYDNTSFSIRVLANKLGYDARAYVYVSYSPDFAEGTYVSAGATGSTETTLTADTTGIAGFENLKTVYVRLQLRNTWLDVSQGKAYVYWIQGEANVNAVPVFSPAGPEISGATSVSISYVDPTADIYYTTDGTIPATSQTGSTLHYEGSVAIDNNMTLKAIAVVGGQASAVASQTYHYAIAATPVFSPDIKYISGPTEISIDCATTGASIYYTTDDSDPATSSTRMLYNDHVIVNNNTILKAVAQAAGYADSAVTSMTYTVPSPYNRPATIKEGIANVDGDLSDWADATWTPLDQPYNGNATDIEEAYYAARWQEHKVYVAVKVRETSAATHYFSEDYGVWTARDAVEIYIHTDNTGDPTYANWTTAQQYVIGIKNSDPTQVWTAIGGGGSATPITEEMAPLAAQIGSAAGSVDGEWIYYEIEMTPFTYLDVLAAGDLSTSTVSTLKDGDVIGLDVCAVGNNAGTYTGMKSENMMTGKSNSWEKFGLHALKATPVTVVEEKSGTLTTTPNGSLDLVLHNGSVHVKGNVYKHIVLSGTLTNWTGYTASNWTGTWGFISLLGSDYFINRNVPAEVDETMSIFSYAGDSSYGDGGKQRGFGANGGVVFYKNINTGTGGFAAEDCGTGAGHKAEMGTNVLADPSRFEYEIVYDLSAMTMTARVKDVGDTEWDSVATVNLGLRNITGSDDWSDVVMSMQMANNLAASGTSYGFDYTMQMAVGNMLSGDANCDGVVNVGDLGILAANYSGSGKGWNQGDFNHDGVVNVGDLGILAANYGAGVNGASDFASDYAKVFGTAVAEEEEPEEELDTTLCGALGLPLVAGLVLMSLMLVKLEE